MQLADMHMHLGFASTPASLAESLCSEGVACFANTVTPDEYLDLESSCGSFESIRLGIGLHPWWISADEQRNDALLQSFIEALPSSRFVGEIGLDFSPKYHALKEQQMRCFEQIIAVCAKHGDSLMSIHAVHAESEALDVLEEAGLAESDHVIFHSYGGSSENLQRATNLGAFFSIGSRMLATKRGKEYARIIPRNRILVESDLPSSQGNDVSVHDIVEDLERTLRAIAEIRGINAEELQRAITARSLALLGCPNQQ